MPLSFARQLSMLPRGFVSDKSRRRTATYPLANSSRKKARRWPLVLRFWKGSIHGRILFPVFVHSVLAAFVVYVNQHINSDFNLPSSIIPSLSIVVGLMLVFRNQTAYSRFWDGRCHLNTVTTSIRCISRQILVLVPAPSRHGLQFYSSTSKDSLLPPNYPPSNKGSKEPSLSGSRSSLGLERAEIGNMGADTNADGTVTLARADEHKTIETIRILIAMLYTIKNHLRADWGVALSPGTMLGPHGQESTGDEYNDLLPPGFKGYEHRGLGLTLELATFVEKFIAMGVKKDWFHNAASGTMLSSLNTLTSAYGEMEVIRLVPIPVAHLIHHRQTLALFCLFLPFAMAHEMNWWAVPLVAFVAFTLYGIEGIAQTYEDPFGMEKIDINMDDVVEDARREVEAMLTAWQTQGPSATNINPSTIDPSNPHTNNYHSSIFRPRVGGPGPPATPRSMDEADGTFMDASGAGRGGGGSGRERGGSMGGRSYANDDGDVRSNSQIRIVVDPGTPTPPSTKRQDSRFSAYTDDDPMEIKPRGSRSRSGLSSNISPGSTSPDLEGGSGGRGTGAGVGQGGVGGSGGGGNASGYFGGV
ncbi:Bestrophin, RFP-TM, chloride channel-domain-containing protein [Cadophora sp. MPI-SDFR-AT-0126]|nr:Bestrophin, RFP-TM, chloride channel-domain-containing protein [Leotiomycetes sp. MPI-SDFR-AT-0126]